MPTPNLLIAGFQKCASSTLFDLLVKHPDIIGSNPKETYYLTDEGYDNFDYLRNSSNPDASWESFYNGSCAALYFLEGSVCNFYQQNARAFVQQHPGTKVIFILRDPVDRFISNYKYYYNKAHGIDSAVSIAQYYDLVKKGNYSRHALKYAIEHGRYLHFLNEWKSIAGEQNICIIGLKELAGDPNLVMEKLTNFLELKSFRVNDLKKTNVSKQVVHAGFHKKLYRLIGGKFNIPPFLKRWYVNIFSKEFSVLIDESLRKALEKEYEAEYEALGQYF